MLSDLLASGFIEPGRCDRLPLSARILPGTGTGIRMLGQESRRGDAEHASHHR